MGAGDFNGATEGRRGGVGAEVEIKGIYRIRRNSD